MISEVTKPMELSSDFPLIIDTKMPLICGLLFIRNIRDLLISKPWRELATQI